MIREYALEPELVAGWSNPQDYRYFIDKFGIGTGRLISRYPQKWTKMVWEAFHSDQIMDRKRMETLLQQLTGSMVRRKDYFWQLDQSWIDNALLEHERHSFDAILARNSSRSQGFILNPNDLEEATSPLWQIKPSDSFPRDSESMAGAVTRMLSCCREAIFVDPFFRAQDLGRYAPQPSRWINPMRRFLIALQDGRTPLPRRIELQASGDYKNAPLAAQFESECRAELTKLLPAGFTMKVIRWKQRPGNEKLHDRFILTDIDGVEFSVGLDEGNLGETTRISLLKPDDYRLRWQQYAGSSPAFDPAENPFEISNP